MSGPGETSATDAQSPPERTGPPAMTALAGMSAAARRRLPRISLSDRDAMMDELLPTGDRFRSYLWRFTTLLVLSAAIAAFGLLSDSVAVVIGAMLVAPLMTPILATAAAICTSDSRRLVRATVVLIGGTLLAIAVGIIVSKLSGRTIVTADDLPAEVLSRTEPGLLDLGIAVAAGAAGGYVAPRRDATSALPGVGIAVALVPPLAAVGITLEAGATSDARGALLLYLTNLAAIIFAGAVMLLASGVAPPEIDAQRRVRVGLMVTVGAVVAVAIPLTLHTLEVIEDTQFERAVTAAIREWDDTVDVVELSTDVDDGQGNVELRIASANESRPAWELAELIAVRHDGPVDLLLASQSIDEIQVSAR